MTPAEGDRVRLADPADDRVWTVLHVTGSIARIADENWHETHAHTDDLERVREP